MVDALNDVPQHEIENALQIRVDPRPDPLRVRTGPAWAGFVPAAATALLCLVATLVLNPRDLGLVACGAALWAVASSVLRGAFGEFCVRFHLAAGLFALALFRGADGAGEFASAAAVLLVGDLVARRMAHNVRKSVAPLAGNVPWTFRSSYRRLALQSGGIGIAVGLVLIAIAPNPIVKIVGVACLPIALRCFGMNLMSGRSKRNLWVLTAFFHAAALAAFVPTFGPLAAAWTIVVSETMLVVGIGALVMGRAGFAPFPMQKFVIASAASLMLFAVAIPGTGLWPILVALIGATGSGVLFLPNRRSKALRA